MPALQPPPAPERARSHPCRWAFAAQAAQACHPCGCRCRLEERSVFNGDARCDHVAGQRSIAADIDPVAGRQIATHFAEHYDFAALMLAATTPFRPMVTRFPAG